MEVTLVAVTKPANETLAEFLERIGRVSHASEPRGDPDAFIRKLIQLGHESVLEHVSFTFYIEGISRACLQQLVRHRIASFTVESQRYVDVSQNQVVVPESISSNKDALKAYAQCVSGMSIVYSHLLELGVPKEDARFVLPVAKTTRLYMTMNLRELRHFLKLRLSKHAQWEIRSVARRILDLARAEIPVAFEDLNEEYANA